MIATFSKTGNGAFQVVIEDDLETKVTFGTCTREFSSPQEAYDTYRPFTTAEHAYWSICYHLEDYLEEKPRPTICDRFPNIVKATIEMSFANGGIYRGLRAGKGRTERDVKRALAEVLGADGVYEDDLRGIDTWLGTLTEEQLSIVVDGEETEIEALVAHSPDPEKTQGLMQDIFDNAC